MCFYSSELRLCQLIEGNYAVISCLIDYCCARETRTNGCFTFYFICNNVKGQKNDVSSCFREPHNCIVSLFNVHHDIL